MLDKCDPVCYTYIIKGRENKAMARAKKVGMKANKKHGIVEGGKFYVGGHMNRRKRGRGKIGTNEKDLSTRISNIRRTDGKDFNVFAYIQLTEATKARLELIESWVREGLESKYTHVGNDHFEFPMMNNKEGYEQFTRDALTLAIEICTMKRWDFSLIYK